MIINILPEYLRGSLLYLSTFFHNLLIIQRNAATNVRSLRSTVCGILTMNVSATRCTECHALDTRQDGLPRWLEPDDFHGFVASFSTLVAYPAEQKAAYQNLEFTAREDYGSVQNATAGESRKLTTAWTRTEQRIAKQHTATGYSRLSYPVYISCVHVPR